ncbi:hypothetical protein [Mycobacterium persicum]|uniref:hypothetical protein n=1 Tax=Mycobacterium persicum TaxID=1487726 RepID=UPI0010423517
MSGAAAPSTQRDDWLERMTLGEQFDPRKNALNAFRLALAIAVILWHCFPLTGRDVDVPAVRQLLSSVRFSMRTDLSYGVYIFAFPIQRLLVIGGLDNVNPFALWGIATLATLPIAALSWFLAEKPALSCKTRFLKRKSAARGRPHYRANAQAALR